NFWQRIFVWKVAIFVNEEFPTEIQKFTKMQQPLFKLKVAIFYTSCWQMRDFFISFNFFIIFFFFKIQTLSENSVNFINSEFE
ncbi:hypothetical protein BTO14_14605, partial [Polaribacter butkevichii]